MPTKNTSDISILSSGMQPEKLSPGDSYDSSNPDYAMCLVGGDNFSLDIMFNRDEYWFAAQLGVIGERSFAEQDSPIFYRKEAAMIGISIIKAALSDESDVSDEEEEEILQLVDKYLF